MYASEEQDAIRIRDFLVELCADLAPDFVVIGGWRRLPTAAGRVRWLLVNVWKPAPTDAAPLLSLARAHSWRNLPICEREVRVTWRRGEADAPGACPSSGISPRANTQRWHRPSMR